MTETAADKITARKMWFAVAAGFLLLATAWTTFIVLARRVRVESEPLATQRARP